MAELENQQATLMELTTHIASAFLGNNSVAASDLPSLIRNIHAALAGVDQPVEAPVEIKAPAVSIKKSLGEDYLICLEDGRKFKSLKRHLRTKYNLSPDEYRAKWGLPRTYPMVAPAYATARSNLAKQMGLGLGGRQAPAAKAVKVSKPATRPAAKTRGART
jgi:predicted transcriptional regulator